MTSPTTATVTTGGTVVLDGAAGTEISFTKPSTVVAGDLILATVTTDGSATLTPTTGWTQTITPLAISTGAKLHVFHRIAAGSTPGFYVVGTPTGKWGGVLTTFHDVDTTTPFDVAFKTASNVTYTASSLTIPGITTITPGAMVVAGIGADKTDALFGQPSGSTTLGEAHAGQGTQVDVSSWPAPGSTGNVIYNFAANTAVAGFVGAIRPKTLTAATPTTAALTLTPGTGTITADWTLSVGSDGANGAIVSRDGTDTTGAGPWIAPNALGTSGTRTFDKLVSGSTYNIKVQPTKDGAAVGTATTKSAAPTAGTTTPPAPAASFTASTLSGTAPLAVSFTDTSTNTPTSWSWTFGDGSSSTAQNPSKTYASAGTYTVTLTASNAGGTSTPVTKSISVTAAPSGPSVTLVSPTSGQTLSGSVTFNATSSDAASIAYYVDGVKVAEDLTTPDFDEAVDTTTLSNGSHVVKAVATNANGSTTTPSITVTVANGTTTPPSSSGTRTGGSGGSKTDRLSLSFSSGGMTSTYHLFAGGLDWTKEVGFMVYMDGSGAYGLDNPNVTYLLDADGTAGLVAVAKKHNLVLLTPIAPPPSDADGDNCWYNTSTTPNAAAKSDWLRALVDQVYSQYDIEKARVAIGGYSSGAQGTTRWFIPRHGAAVQADGVFVAISYGGAPDASAGTPTFTADYKSKVVGYWNTGAADPYAYGTASYQAQGGYNWYTSNGFTTQAAWPAGVTHDRSDFAAIMDAQVTAHVRAAQSTGGTTTPPPSSGTQPVGVPGTWTLAFADEFDGTALDTSKWAANWYAEGGEMNGVGTYARNVSVANGELRLQLESATAGALVHTDIDGGYRFPVGSYVEARIYFPGPSSTALSNWSAWWASSTAADGWPSSGEHDIAEILSGQLTANYHSPSGAHNQGAVAGFTPGNSWHTYGVHRKAGSADVYWDGVKVKSYTTDDNGKPEILILNVGSGSNDAFGATGAMRVDYVRAWSPQA